MKKEHYPEASGSDHRTRIFPSEMLSSPHLMLTDAGGDDNILLLTLGLLVEFLNNLLRLNGGAVSAALVSEGIFSLPLLDISEPTASG